MQRPVAPWQPALQALAQRTGDVTWWVALSGGADSTALLRSALDLRPGRVRALHVHHGLQAAADDFVRCCQDLCHAQQVPLQVLRVQAGHRPGQSPEDAARLARRQALAQAAGPGAHVLLAQHADDQLETLLLALTRGAGPDGLAAMPATQERLGCFWHRPLLETPAATLRDWLRALGQPWIEDPSNQHLAHPRNRLRHQVIPALAEAFPGIRQTAARSARLAAQSARIVREQAAHDLLQTGVPPRIAALQQLTPERQAQALRLWLRQAHQTTPSEAQLIALQTQLQACRTRGHRIDLRVGSGQLRREGDTLRWQPQD